MSLNAHQIVHMHTYMQSIAFTKRGKKLTVEQKWRCWKTGLNEMANTWIKCVSEWVWVLLNAQTVFLPLHIWVRICEQKKTRKSFCSFYNHTVRSNVFVYGSMWAFVSSSSTHMQHAFSPVVSDAYKNISANRFLFALFTISFLSLFFAFSRVRRN